MTTNDYTLRTKISAPPGAVYTALTDPAALRTWLADEAETAPESGVFGFWGKHIPDGDQARQTLVAAEPGRRLAFAWDVGGTRHQADFDLAADGDDRTAVTLRLTGVPTDVVGQYSLRDFWYLSLDNLATYCEGRGPVPMCDFIAMQPGAARASADIAAAPAAVFAALTQPDQLERWIAEKAVVEPQVGGRYEFGWEAEGPVRILELEPDRALAYSWQSDNLPADTVVRWELEGSGNRTKLTIVHSGFGPDHVPGDFQLGWQAFLAALKRMLEVGPAWSAIERVAG